VNILPHSKIVFGNAEFFEQTLMVITFTSKNNVIRSYVYRYNLFVIKRRQTVVCQFILQLIHTKFQFVNWTEY